MLLLAQVDKTVGSSITRWSRSPRITASRRCPEWLRERGMPGGRMTTDELFDPVQRALTDGIRRRQVAAGGRRFVAVSGLRTDREAKARSVGRAAGRRRRRGQGAAVARVYTRDQLLRGEVPNDRIGNRLIRGFNAQRSGDLEIILEPHWIRQAKGATHGTPYAMTPTSRWC